MRQNIQNNYHGRHKLRLVNDKYYDFALYDGAVYNDINYNERLIVDINDSSFINGKLYSNAIWQDAINKGVTLYNIGLTGMDNGFITYRKDRISNKEFMDLLLNSEFNINENDMRFFMTPIRGNTLDYTYPFEKEDGYISLKGGFFQGFFKLDNMCYQVLPSKLDNEWNINITLRPRSDYKIEEGTMNDLHPENNGFFFYIGTRAENKFYPFYNVSESSLQKLVKENTSNDGYLEDGDFVYNNVTHEQYLNDYIPEETCDKYFIDDYISGNAETIISPLQTKNGLNINNFYDNTLISDSANCCKGGDCNNIQNAPIDDCSCDTYFQDDYFEERCGGDNILPEEYIEKEIEININDITTDEGHEYTKKGYYEIKTDNKFILFNRTKTGFTAENWVEGDIVTLTGRTDWDDYNYHILMNRTKTGYTINDVNSLHEKNKKEYNIYKDIVDNALGFRIKDDGSIGYRYGTVDCESEEKYGIVEEYSYPNKIKKDEWNNIHIKIVPLNPKKMRIKIYVNGRLILISKELNILNLRHLNDVSQKQEGVPYNISLGGGTQGCLEAIYPDYYNQPQFILPLERDFCGTFIGDIKTFKMYNGFLNYLIIKDYLSK